MFSTTIIVAALLLLVSPRKMQQIVIAALIAYAFPQQAGIAVIIASTVYMLHYLFIQKLLKQATHNNWTVFCSALSFHYTN